MRSAKLSRLAVRKQAEINRQKAWDLHIDGVPGLVIAEELGVSTGRVSQYIKEAAKLHPVNKLSMEERMALAEARWQKSEDEIKAEIARQLQEARTPFR